VSLLSFVGTTSPITRKAADGYSGKCFKMLSCMLRSRKSHPVVRRFELVALIVVVVGLPLAFLVPSTFQGKFYAVFSVAVLAFACGGAAALLVKREEEAHSAAKLMDLEAFAPAGKPDTSRWSVELLKRLEWKRFEELVAAYFAVLEFRAESIRPPDNGGSERGERGVLALKLFKESKPVILVGCQAWSVYTVGIRPVRALLEAMRAQGIAEGAFVTSARFTPEAQALAAKSGITLIDGADFLAKISALAPEHAAALLALAVAGDFLTPTCPACGVKMAARSNTPYGRKFWGCINYPRCSQTFFGALNAPS